MASLHFRSSDALTAVNENVFAEIEYTTSRPMEYRRRPRRIWATLTSWELRLETASDDEIAQRRKWKADREKREPDTGSITMAERLSQTLSADLDLPKREFGTITADGTRAIECSIRLQVSGSDQEAGQFRHWPKSSHAEEAMFCTVAIQRERMDWLVSELSRRPAVKLVVGFELPAFEYEVDDALGEHWMHKVFYVEPDAAAPVTSFQVILSDDYGTPSLPSANPDGDAEPDDTDDQIDQQPQQIDRFRNATGLPGQAETKQQLVLWIIAGLLLLSLFK